jgi:gliding motility-associated-like protein
MERIFTSFNSFRLPCNKGKNRYAIFMLLLIFITFSSENLYAQCDASVPTFNVNLVGQPSGTYTTPPVIRTGNCCGTESPDRCIQFIITLDSQAVAVNFQITSGAIPPGSLFYQVDCGPQSQVGEYICITGPGPHILTFCKPGNNTNQFTVYSIPSPIFPNDDTIRVGCSKPVVVQGLTASTVTWNSVYPGTSGQYNNYLSCTSGCTSPAFTPDGFAPPYIDYVVCGFPTADQCGFTTLVCDTVRIYTAAPILGLVTPNPASYCPTSPGVTLTVSASGGVGNFTYEWLDPNGTIVGTGISYFATSPGTYNVKIYDELEGCPPLCIAVPVTVSTISLSTSKTDVNCFSACNGSATVSPSGGAGPYTYLWQPGNLTGQTITNICAGSYTVTVTDAGGCTASASITINQPSALNVSITSPVGPGGTNIGCAGETNGSATANPSGGVSPYTYLWNNAQTSQTISNLGAGLYQVTITDNNGCTSTDTLSLTEPDSIVVLIDSVVFNSGSTIQCHGDNSGSACVTVIGGTTPYFYNWSTGDTVSCISGQSAGTVYLTVTDANGCSKGPLQYTFIEPNDFITSVSSPTFAGGYNVSCFGAADGSIDLTVSGASVPYTYEWSNAETTQDLTGLEAGFYSVTITDFNGCTTELSITLSEPPVLDVTLTSPVSGGGTNIGCNGQTDGSLTANPTGGTGPYSYLWSNTQTTQTITNLSADTYQVTVTDANNCVITATMTLTEPDTLVPLISGVTVTGGSNLSCYGDSNATASVSVSGGTAPYSYEWSNGDSLSSTGGLSAGMISVTVTDANGCSASDSYIITEPAPLSASMSASLFNGNYNISCNGAADGTATVSPSGATPPYTYLWSDTQITQTANGLSAGWISVTVEDVNGCIYTDSIELIEPDVLNSTLDPFVTACGTNISCAGGDDGSIDLEVSGGAAPYTYLWSNTATSEDIAGLQAGFYLVTVTDANGCTSSATATLTEPTALMVNSIISPVYPGGWNVSCNGGDDGSVEATASGGCAPYSYSWSNGDSTEIISGVSVSIYIVTITDVNGCTARDSILLTEPPLLTASVSSTDANCSSSCDGTGIVSSVNGGTAPYSYLWSNNDSTATSSNLCVGSYTVTITDVNGCSTSGSITISEPTMMTMSVTIDNQVSCFNACNGQASVSTLSGGTTPYTYLWSTGVTTATVSGLCVGTHTVTVTDANNCSLVQSITITEPDLLLASVVVDNQNSCFNACDGQASITGLTGGTGPYSILWSNNDTASLSSNLCPGNYSVTITDANSCTVTGSISITEPALLNISASVDNQVDCFSSCNGQASVTLSTGGTLPYSYQWNNNDTGQIASNLCAGSYSVTITDDNGCTASTSVIISEPQLLTVSASVTSNASCSGICDGIATVSSTYGGTAPYSYLWSNGETTNTITNLCEGIYTVTVTDENGCTETTTVTIIQPQVLSLNQNIIDASCNNVCDGAIDIDPSGGTLPYAFNWSSGQSNEDLTGLCAGIYTVTVTDANGCSSSVSYTITEPDPVVAIAGTDQVICGRTTILAAGNESGTWSVISGTAIFADANDPNTAVSGLSYGTNILEWYVNVNGCFHASAIKIESDEEVTAIASPDASICELSYLLVAAQPSVGSGRWSVTGNGMAIIHDPANHITSVSNLNICDNIFLWTVTNGDCIESDSVIVYLKTSLDCDSLAMPTAFTPNRDGYNDVFEVLGLLRHPDNQLIIFNRWGNEVFRKDRYANDWAGTNKSGDPLPDGTYFVILKVNDLNRVLKGYVDIRK